VPSPAQPEQELWFRPRGEAQGAQFCSRAGADRTRQLSVLAARGWAVSVDREPNRDDFDLLAVIRPVSGTANATLGKLAPAVKRRRTNRRVFTGAAAPVEMLRALTTIATDEGAVLVPVLTESHRHLVARLTQQADRVRNAEPAYRAELRRWTRRAG
jgi:hypothetical protein